MLSLYILAAGLSAEPLTACADAVSANSPLAARDCTAPPTPRENNSLWGGRDLSPTCLSALRMGRDTARLTGAMRAGAVRAFEDRLAECRAGPRAQPATPPLRKRQSQRLWD